MTADGLTAALHARAADLYPLEAGVALRTRPGNAQGPADIDDHF